MSILVLVSIALRVLNFCWSIVLVRRVRDKRLWFLPPMMVMTVLRQTIHHFEGGGAWTIVWTMPVSEVPGFILSGLTFLMLFTFDRIFRERNEAQEALQASLAKYFTAFESSPDAIVITSRRSEKVLEVNEGFTRLFDYKRQDVVGRSSCEVDIWEDRRIRDQALASVERFGRVRDLPAGFRSQSGTVLACLISVERIELDGEPCTLTVMRDVTDLKRAEQEREAFVRELETKNSELERFTYTVSHDLKSPLVTIRGFVGLLERDVAAGRVERMTDDIARIDSAAATMGRLLDELLELSRVGRVAHPPERVALAEIAHHAAELVGVSPSSPGRDGTRNVLLEIDDELPAILGDRPRLTEVFQNLVDNAVKFMGAQTEPRIEIGQRHENGEVVVYVRDNGQGIESRYHDQVFGLFERLDTSIEGTGVGLALVKRIVEVHGGRIWIESDGPGLGSAFCFVLPGLEGADHESPADPGLS